MLLSYLPVHEAGTGIVVSAGDTVLATCCALPASRPVLTHVYPTPSHTMVWLLAWNCIHPRAIALPLWTDPRPSSIKSARAASCPKCMVSHSGVSLLYHVIQRRMCSAQGGVSKQIGQRNNKKVSNTEGPEGLVIAHPFRPRCSAAQMTWCRVACSEHATRHERASTPRVLSIWKFRQPSWLVQSPRSSSKYVCKPYSAYALKRWKTGRSLDPTFHTNLLQLNHIVL